MRTFRVSILLAVCIAAVALIVDRVKAQYRGGGYDQPTTPQPASTVTTQSGGSIKTSLGDGVTLDDKSSLNREWITVHQTPLPADIVGTAGVTTSYSGADFDHGYHYEADLQVAANVPLSAVEIRFITFDLWGSHLDTLVDTEVQDMPVGQTEVKSKWNLFDENDCAAYYASIAYVARVRTRDGRVIEADTGPVMEEARKFSAKFKPEDLEPPAPKR
jgi:hypothetical protein